MLTKIAVDCYIYVTQNLKSSIFYFFNDSLTKITSNNFLIKVNLTHFRPYDALYTLKSHL